jgi:translation initiation factor IF-1
MMLFVAEEAQRAKSSRSLGAGPLFLGSQKCYPAASQVPCPMSKEELVHLDGEVILIAKGGNFRVKLDNGHEVLAKLAGKVRRHRIRVVLGDRVTVAVSPYDPTRGFIVYRQR